MRNGMGTGGWWEKVRGFITKHTGLSDANRRTAKKQTIATQTTQTVKMKISSVFMTVVWLGVTIAQECTVYVPDARDMIVIDAEQRGPGGGWEFLSDLPGYQGSGYLSYKPTSSIGWAEGKPQNMNDGRIKTYWFKVNTPGNYRVVLKSAAPHGTEHNDVFMSLPESGAIMRRHGVNADLTAPAEAGNWADWFDQEKWFKVYQNRGGLQWDYGGKTVDFAGHDVITKELKADGTWYSVRMCGRSTQFNVDRIALFLCDVDKWECDNTSPKFWEATGNAGDRQSQCENPGSWLTVAGRKEQ